MSQNFKKLFRYSLLLSILFHVAFVFYQIEQTRIDNNMKVTFKQPTNNIKAKILQMDNVKKVDPFAGQRQIVTSSKSDNDKQADNSRFLSEKTQSFDRQTVAKKVGSFTEGGKGKTKQESNKKKTVAETKKIAKKTSAPAKKGKVSLADLALADMGYEVTAQKEVQDQNDPGTENGGDQRGIAQSNDFIQDVALGDMTKLNTTEFKFYGFYFRIKQQLEQHWGSTLKEKASSLYKSGRRLPASENLITSLSVLIDDQGNIVNIHVRGTSGIRELDQAAIESFNKAGPFPNPPKEMLENGSAKIEWGFVVKG